MKTKLRDITKDFFEFWVWQPVIDRVRVYDDNGVAIDVKDDFTHYDFRGRWVIAMRDPRDMGSFFLPDIDFFKDLQEIGDCIAVGIPRPPLPDALEPERDSIYTTGYEYMEGR